LRVIDLLHVWPKIGVFIPIEKWGKEVLLTVGWTACSNPAYQGNHADIHLLSSQAISEEVQPSQQGRQDSRVEATLDVRRAATGLSRRAAEAEKPRGGSTPGSKKGAAHREPLAEISAPTPPSAPTPTRPAASPKADWHAGESHLENVAPPALGTQEEGSPSIERDRQAGASVTLITPEAPSR